MQAVFVSAEVKRFTMMSSTFCASVTVASLSLSIEKHQYFNCELKFQSYCDFFFFKETYMALTLEQRGKNNPFFKSVLMLRHQQKTNFSPCTGAFDSKLGPSCRVSVGSHGSSCLMLLRMCSIHQLRPPRPSPLFACILVPNKRHFSQMQ